MVVKNNVYDWLFSARNRGEAYSSQIFTIDDVLVSNKYIEEREKEQVITFRDALLKQNKIPGYDAF